MKPIKPTTLEQFYHEAADFTGRDIASLLPPDIHQAVGHFNIFDIAATTEKYRAKNIMPYNRRAYYKISLMHGKAIAHYADKTIEINGTGLLFATPRIPYHWVPDEQGLTGTFCIFTHDFMLRSKTGFELDELPLFKSGSQPVFMPDAATTKELEAIFAKMSREIASDYPYKYDLLRNYVTELLHMGQKLQPLTPATGHSNGAERVASLFAELLERQFPIESPGQQLQLRTAAQFADRLAIHVNHLNKSLKDITGQTTTGIIAQRIVQEAKILLKQTDWNIAEIAWSLGFAEAAHFSNFFRKNTGSTPVAFRQPAPTI